MNTWPEDCDGLCYPVQPGSTLDALCQLASLQRARLAVKRLASESGGPTSEVCTALLQGCAPDALARLFSSPVAALDMSKECPPLMLARHLIHHPDARDFVIMLPPEIFVRGGLYLPHAHAIIRNDGSGPVAVLERDGHTHLVWTDGMAIVLANNGMPLPEELTCTRLKPLPRLSGFPLLSSVPEVAPIAAPYDPVAIGAASLLAPQLASGLDLLHMVWPQALHALRRHLRGIVLLQPRGHGRSHSPEELPMTTFLTLDSPDRVADYLCHELSHIRMQAFRNIDPIVTPADPERARLGFASPWRPDPRPLRGLLDGIHAFLNVCHFHRRLAGLFPGTTASLQIYESHKQNILLAWATVAAHAKPTRLGQLVLSEFAREVALL